jgi:hypothetical protein
MDIRGVGVKFHAYEILHYIVVSGQLSVLLAFARRKSLRHPLVRSLDGHQSLSRLSNDEERNSDRLRDPPTLLSSMYWELFPCG